MGGMHLPWEAMRGDLVTEREPSCVHVCAHTGEIRSEGLLSLVDGCGWESPAGVHCAVTTDVCDP